VLSSGHFEIERPGIGAYVTQIDITHAGSWGVEATGRNAAGAIVTARATFVGRSSAIAKVIGDRAPDVATDTFGGAGADIRTITTDPNPDPVLYAQSARDVLKRGVPFLLIFASPGYCPSQQCLPLLNLVKTEASSHPEFTMIHQEPYVLGMRDGKTTPELNESGEVRVADAANAWGLLSQPWVFVVNGKGLIVASFQTVFDQGDLDAAVASAEAG
jgi:hypothetical protein